MMTLSQRSAGGAVARAKSLVAPPRSLCLYRWAELAVLELGELAAAPAPRSQWGHEHAELGHAGPKVQIIGPENTLEAKPNDDALTGLDGNGAGPPDDKGARPPTLAAKLFRVS